jgi:hypothetical protein
MPAKKPSLDAVPTPGSLQSSRSTDLLMSQMGSSTGKSPALLPLDNAIENLAVVQVRVAALVKAPSR